VAQKLVTIALEGSPPQHGMVQEHLADLLQAGWRVLSVTAVGSSTGELSLRRSEPARRG